MASVFLVKDLSKKENLTFYNDENLPSLPVPSVEQTIEKYLDSCKAILSDEDYKNTELICRKFVEKDAARLQEKLLQRASERKNWLEQWWLEKAYLETRTPLPLVNFSGPGTYVEHYWPLQPGTQLERVAQGLHIFMQLWQVIRKEMLAVHMMGEGKYLNMSQFRYLFNTCRIPHRGRDEIHHSFLTEAEGSSPTHMIVLCKGYVFKIDGVDSKTGEITSPPQFLKMVQQIHAMCESKGQPGPGLPALTALDRDKWADARDHMISINPANRESLREIETALLVTAIGETSPQDYTDLTYEALLGDPALCWYDKSYNSITSLNGGCWCNCDHTPYDAMVMVALVEFYTHAIKQFKGVWNGPLEIEEVNSPVEIDFKLDQTMLNYIAEAKDEVHKMRENLELLQIVFDKFGKSELKEYKVHPDFMVQLCLQLAHLEVHGKPAPTYETAMTRQYYHGRTETCRSCTPEAVAFCKAILNERDPQSADHQKLTALFWAAHSKFLSLMSDCMLNKGCDRHLMGLALIALENGYDIPEIFIDPSFAATGGNGNFVLSTSCVGYFHAQGSVAPMVDHGYGFFYRINDHKLIYSVSAFNSNDETNARKFADSFEYSLISVLNFLKRSVSAKM